jgi:hypothetical protein
MTCPANNNVEMNQQRRIGLTEKLSCSPAEMKSKNEYLFVI